MEAQPETSIQMRIPEASTQMRIAVYIIRKHKVLILSFFVITVIVTALLTLLATPMFSASSRLLVKAGREDVYVSPTGETPAVINRPTKAGEKLNSEIAILKSPRLVDGLIESFGFGGLFNYPIRNPVKAFFSRENEGREKRNYPPIERIRRSITKNIEAVIVPNSSVIEVSFAWPDPFVAAQVVNKLVDLYLVHHLKVHTEDQTDDMLKNQASEWQERLKQSEEELKAFKHNYSIISYAQEKEMLLQMLTSIERQRQEAASEMKEASLLSSSIEEALASVEQNVQLQERVDKQSPTLVALQGRLVDLQLHGLKEEVTLVRQRIAEEERKEHVTLVSGESPIRQKLEGDLINTQGRVWALRGKVNSLKEEAWICRERLTRLEEVGNELGGLERRRNISEANYELYLAKFEEAKISDSMDKHKIANIGVIERASPSLEPIRPRKTRTVIIGGMLSLWISLGLAFLVEFINPVFRTREDIIQYLNLQVLGTLPNEQ